jgi:hypothetical protein
MRLPSGVTSQAMGWSDSETPRAERREDLNAVGRRLQACPLSHAAEQLAYPEWATAVGGERRGVDAIAIAYSAEQLAKSVIGSMARLPAELRLGPPGIRERHGETHVEPSWLRRLYPLLVRQSGTDSAYPVRHG